VVALLEHLEEQMDGAFTMVRLWSLATLMCASNAAGCASLTLQCVRPCRCAWGH
jgi:hypothetical protein